MKKQKSILWIMSMAFVFAALTLAACGSGGGSGGGGNNPPSVTGPTAPPATGVLQVNTGTAHAAFSHFRIAFNNAGQGVAVWEENSGAVVRVLWSYFDGAAFSPEAELVQYGRNPTVSTNGTDFMIVWENGYLYYATCSSGGVVGTPARLSTASGDYSELASNGTGYAAVWSQGGNLNASTYTAGAWNTPVLIENNPTYIGILKMASNGTGYAVAYRDNGNLGDVGSQDA